MPARKANTTKKEVAVKSSVKMTIPRKVPKFAKKGTVNNKDKKAKGRGREISATPSGMRGIPATKALVIRRVV